MRVVLTIAGFDPSGGAGVLADCKTFAAFGCFGTAVITSLTAQNTVAVYGAHHQPAEVVRAQLEPVLADFEIAAVKLGMLPHRACIETVAEIIERCALPNVVLDPVIRSSSGYELIDESALAALIELLLPLTRVVTPNLSEAERLAGQPVQDLAQMEQAAQYIRALCQARPVKSAAPGAVLIKGGHLTGEAIDLLDDGETVRVLRAPKIATRNTHGTGCTLSAAIAAALALGDTLPEAVQRAKQYVSTALLQAPDIGHGAGPLNHSVKSR